jgi:hypothetical protein
MVVSFISSNSINNPSGNVTQNLINGAEVDFAFVVFPG